MKPTNGREAAHRQEETAAPAGSLDPDRQARLLAQFDDDLPSSVRGRAILRVFLDTGLRAAELINLRHRDVDLATGRLWVRLGKGQKDRGLWFNGNPRQALEAWLAISRFRPVFIFHPVRRSSLPWMEESQSVEGGSENSWAGWLKRRDRKKMPSPYFPPLLRL